MGSVMRRPDGMRPAFYGRSERPLIPQINSQAVKDNIKSKAALTFRHC
jgi:hypothetical protein